MMIISMKISTAVGENCDSTLLFLTHWMGGCSFIHLPTILIPLFPFQFFLLEDSHTHIDTH